MSISGSSKKWYLKKFKMLYLTQKLVIKVSCTSRISGITFQEKVLNLIFGFSLIILFFSIICNKKKRRIIYTTIRVLYNKKFCIFFM